MSVGSGSKAVSTAASMSDSLSGKTRKIVPSAMPAASAIWRVVTPAPCSISSGMVADTMAARRSTGRQRSGPVAGVGVLRARRRPGRAEVGGSGRHPVTLYE